MRLRFLLGQLLGSAGVVSPRARAAKDSEVANHPHIRL